MRPLLLIWLLVLVAAVLPCGQASGQDVVTVQDSIQDTVPQHPGKLQQLRERVCR